MTEQRLRELYNLLDGYRKNKHKGCCFECNNCELGVLENHGQCSCSCAIDIIMRSVDDELSVETDIDRLIARSIEVNLKALKRIESDGKMD